MVVEDLIAPVRYNSGSIECWDFLNDNGYPYMLGAPVKYVWRFRDKGGYHDLVKAKLYLEKVLSDPDKVRVKSTKGWLSGLFNGVNPVKVADYTRSDFDWMSDLQVEFILRVHRLLSPLSVSEFNHELRMAIELLNTLSIKEYKRVLEVER